MTRQIALDTETTGLETRDGHRIIEIGCVELCERRLSGHNLHLYIQPDREIDAGAFAVHGISNEFLADKPRFAGIAQQLIDYLSGAELIIHNADFDVGFLEHELRLCNRDIELAQICQVTDSLALAREQFPGQRNSLDALCKRLGVNNSHRTLHGALLDAEILADVYLRMTGGQTALTLDQEGDSAERIANVSDSVDISRLVVIQADEDELAAHEQWLERLRDSGDGCIWDRVEQRKSPT
ncbi:MAG: DNA polymerase III subunit epsilon [Granulosicoccus sp.]|nr:DNA polymerase III subunit epsilon [Granulosicoccus sp.]